MATVTWGTTAIQAGQALLPLTASVAGALCPISLYLLLPRRRVDRRCGRLPGQGVVNSVLLSWHCRFILA
eukprot:jgi/Phyca11/512147/fgenesh2_kg.PHYCAscaffold_305_\